MENLLVAISQCLNKEIRPEDLVFDFSGHKDQLHTDYNDTMVLGQDLLDRLRRPVLTHDK